MILLKISVITLGLCHNFSWNFYKKNTIQEALISSWHDTNTKHKQAKSNIIQQTKAPPLRHQTLLYQSINILPINNLII